MFIFQIYILKLSLQYNQVNKKPNTNDIHYKDKWTQKKCEGRGIIIKRKAVYIHVTVKCLPEASSNDLKLELNSQFWQHIFPKLKRQRFCRRPVLFGVTVHRI